MHRIGRTGRCGNLGRATSFFCGNSDFKIAPDLVFILKNAGQSVPNFLTKVNTKPVTTGGVTAVDTKKKKFTVGDDFCSKKAYEEDEDDDDDDWGRF